MNRKQRIANTTTHCRLMLYLFTIEAMVPWQRRMTVRYYLGTIAVMWRRVMGARLTLMPGQHRLEFSRHPGRVQLPVGLHQA